MNVFLPGFFIIENEKEKKIENWEKSANLRVKVINSS